MSLENTPKGNFKNFTEASASVQGIKYQLVSKFPTSNRGITYKDLISVADIAIWTAWIEWNPENIKFVTHAGNRIKWAVFDELNAMESSFKSKALTTYQVGYYDKETFKNIQIAGKTKDDEFNKEHNLDGSDEAKKRITRFVYNAYIAKRNKEAQIIMTPVSSFGIDADGFDILDTAVGNNSDFEIMEMEMQLKDLGSKEQIIARMLLDGADIVDVANELKMTQKSLMSFYAPSQSKFGQKRPKTRGRRRPPLTRAEREMV